MDGGCGGFDRPPSAFILFLSPPTHTGSGETLHLVREEILLGPPLRSSALCFLLLPLCWSCGRSAGAGGWGWDRHNTPPSCPHHPAPFAFLITLQMCLMAEQSLCTERGGSRRNPEGLPAYVSCHEPKKKIVRGQGGREGASMGVNVGLREREVGGGGMSGVS